MWHRTYKGPFMKGAEIGSWFASIIKVVRLCKGFG